jgi:hypothetical protein
MRDRQCQGWSAMIFDNDMKYSPGCSTDNDQEDSIFSVA